MAEFKTLAELIDVSAQKYADRPLFGAKKNGVYEWMTYADFHTQMEKLRYSFHEMGMKQGDVVAIIASNSIPFAMTVYAAYGLGASIVPMYEVQKIQDWEYILKDSKARFLFTGNPGIKERIESLGINSIERIVSFFPRDDHEPDEFQQLIDSAAQQMKTLDIDEHSIADIIYTSGTTGTPKGVELTHHNIVYNAIDTFDGFDASCTDRSMAFLPWAHAFGKTVELHIFPYFGAAVGLAESARMIQTNLKEVNPTILVAVPKIFNKIYDEIRKKAYENPISRKLLEDSIELNEKSHHKPLSGLDRIRRKVLCGILGSKIKSAFGSSLRFCISGGAPLAPDIIEFFHNFGLTIYEGYGMTETAPIIAVNKHGKIKFGSVGRPLACNTVRIELDPSRPEEHTGEVIVGGHCVMHGYHNAPELTAEVLTNDHELHTGDLGYLDEDGYLYLTGRVKEQYKLENGKYVVPSALEEKLNTSLYIEHSIIFGAGRPYNIVLIKPTEKCLEDYKNSKNGKQTDARSIAKDDILIRMIDEEIQKITKNFRGFEKPQKFAVIMDEISIQNGMLTPALKLKRHEIEKKYGDIISNLYK